MTSEPNRTIPQEAIDAAANLQDAVDLVLENSEGVPWSFYFGTVSALRGACDRVLALEVDNRARMPISTESAERIASTFVVPDDPRGVDDEPDNHGQ